MNDLDQAYGEHLDDQAVERAFARYQTALQFKRGGMGGRAIVLDQTAQMLSALGYDKLAADFRRVVGMDDAE